MIFILMLSLLQVGQADMTPVGAVPPQLAPLFSDHMVLQRDEPIPVFGTAEPGATVTVELAGASAEALADGQGRFRVELPAQPAGGPHVMSIHTGGATLKIDDVLVGEVWLASGQSNMEWPVRALLPADVEALQGAAGDDELRFFMQPKASSLEAMTDTGGVWQLDNPQNVGGFSAVAYYFAQQLRDELDVPVGIVATYWGGTPAEAWTPRGALWSDPATAPIAAADPTWNPAAVAERRREGEPVGGNMPAIPGVLYNAMISPHVGYNLRGVIWYQGESNAGRPTEYATLFPLMIRSWRDVWEKPEMPFLFVQLANFMAATDEPVDHQWAHLREAQRRTMDKLDNTGMAVTIDIGDADDIHPRNKRDVGDRLARWALAETYGKDVVRSGPLPTGVAVNKDGSAVVSFEDVAGGLRARGGSLEGFTLAGADGAFVNADAEIIDTSHVRVTADEVKNPTAVRYAWANNPAAATLENDAGLPASPFRTDDFPPPDEAGR